MTWRGEANPRCIVNLEKTGYVSGKKKIICLTLWPWSWIFTVSHTIYVQCEYFMNQEG